MQMTCTSCGAVFELAGPSMRFCPSCGADLTRDASAGGGMSAAGLATIRKPLLPIGVLALVLSIAYGVLVDSADAKKLGSDIARTETEIDKLRAERAKIEDSMRPARALLEQAEAKAASSKAAREALLKEDDRLAGDTALAIDSAREALDAVQDRKEEQEATQAKVEARAEKIREGQELDREAGEHLSAYQRAVVTVFSSDMYVATGFVLSIDGKKHYVATVAEAAPFGKALACTFRRTQHGNTEADFTTAKATLIFVDEHIGLALLVCEPKGTPVVAELDLAGRKAGDSEKGQRIFAIGTQVLGSSAFSENVIDGTISAMDRTDGDLRLLQTTLPSNHGSIGSPIMDQKGDFVGILLGAAEGLERTSVAIPASELTDVLARMRKEIKRGIPSGDVTYNPPHASTAIFEAAARNRPLPYEKEDSLELPLPYGESLDFFPGPSDMIVVWNKKDLTLSAYKKGLERRLWEKSLKSRGYGVANVAYTPWDDNVLVTTGLTQNPSSEINLKMGSTVGRIPVINSVDDTAFSRPYASHKIGQFRILAMNDGLAIVSLSSAKGFNVDIGTLLMARNEDIFTFSTIEGDLGFFTQSGFLPILGRIGSAIDSGDRIINSNISYAKKRAKIQQLNEQIKNLVGELKTGLSWYKGTGVKRDMSVPIKSFSHVPGTYTHIIGTTIWEIGPTDVTRTGELMPIWHSAGDEPWFHAYYRKDAQACAGASPDGKYAVTTTHLYDLKEMKPLVELPFPSGPVGFLSSGAEIYAYDRVNNRVVFISVEELLATGLGPWGSRRNRGAVEK